VLAPTGKVVGISQRRTRAGALFQSAALLRWDPVEAVAALAVDRDAAARDLRAAGVGLDQLVPGVPVGRVAAAVESAVVALSRDGDG